MKKLICTMMLLFLMTGSCFASATDDDVLITAAYQNTPLSIVLDNLSRLSGIPIIINGDLKKDVTMRFGDMRFTKVMELLAMSFNFSWVNTGEAIVVSPTESMTITKTWKIRYMNLSELQSKLNLFIAKDKVSVNKESGTVTVDSTPTNIAKAEQILMNEDIPSKSIMIYAQMIEVSKDDSLKAGFKYSWNDYDSTKSPWKFAYTVTANANNVFSKANILARPFISTLNGNEATIDLSDKYPVISTQTANGTTTSSVDYKDIGVKLKVEPRVNEDVSGELYVTLKLKPTVSVLTGVIEKPNITAPEISTREAETLVRVKNGQSVVIGGLMKTDELETIEGVPFLQNLPIFGKLLFTSRSKEKKSSEVFVVVTPVIQQQ